MMETFEILLNRYLMDEYIEGCIAGLIYIATGTPDDYGYIYSEDGPVATMRFDATKDQVRTVVECINKLRPEVYAGVKVAE